MIDESMIAPCGLDCAICQRALVKENPCPGCLVDSSSKPEFCRDRCLIKKCETRKTLADRFCDTCEQYPCKDVMEKETRYTSAYPMLEAPIGNLFYLRKHGMEALLRREEERWRCPDCGQLICVHSGVCFGCGRAFTELSLPKKQAD